MRRRQATSFRVVQIPEVDKVRITCDGDDFTAWRAVGQVEIELDVTIGDHALVVRTGYFGRAWRAVGEPEAATAPTTGPRTTRALAAPATIALVPVPTMSGLATACACC